jgi:hypothetical protein
MKALHALTKTLFGNLSFCAHIGAIIGAIAGFFFGMLQLLHPGLTLTWSDTFKIGLLLAVVGWLVVLIIVGIWLHYGVRSIAIQALINAIITSVLTVYVNNVIQLPLLSVLIGLMVGILVGSVFCRLCEYYERYYKYKQKEALT